MVHPEPQTTYNYLESGVKEMCEYMAASSERKYNLGRDIADAVKSHFKRNEGKPQPDLHAEAVEVIVDIFKQAATLLSKKKAVSLASDIYKSVAMAAAGSTYTVVEVMDIRVRDLLMSYREDQVAGLSDICPRCGEDIRGSEHMSNFEDIVICPSCVVDEARRKCECADPLPLPDWHVAQFLRRDVL